MKMFYKEFILFQVTILALFVINTSTLLAKDDTDHIQYVGIHPNIVTNYQKESRRKIGFLQFSGQLLVSSKESAELAETHMPLIREHIIVFFNFTDEKMIKDISKRNTLRASLTKGLREMLTEQIGQPIVEDFVITKLIWE